MFQQIDLRQLAEMEGPPHSFVSFYFSDQGSLNLLDRKAEHLRDILADEDDDLGAFDESVARLRDMLEAHEPKAEGYATFACAELDYVVGFELEVSVPTEFRAATHPFLRPLAELQDERENFLIVALDNDHTRIIQVTSATSETAEQVSGHVKNRVKKGGWSQKRYARRRSNELMHYAKEINERLSDLLSQSSFDRIVLLGSQETIDELREQLDQQVAEHVVGADTVDLKAGEDELLEAAYELYFEAERTSERNLWELIREEAAGDGLAAFGPTDVLAAAVSGRVERMIVTRDAEIPGRRCSECTNLMHGTPETCQFCGDKSLTAVDLVDELVRQLELTSAEAEFSDELSGLSKSGDIAALLRY